LGKVYRVSKVLQHFVPEKRGIIPRFPGIKDVLDVAKLLKRGIELSNAKVTLHQFDFS
jgi:hypothetical protein